MAKIKKIEIGKCYWISYVGVVKVTAVTGKDSFPEVSGKVLELHPETGKASLGQYKRVIFIKDAKLVDSSKVLSQYNKIWKGIYSTKVSKSKPKKNGKKKPNR